MDNYICCHCYCPYDYYCNIKHASRRSCKVSKSGYHDFVNKHILNITKFFRYIYKKLFSCFSRF